MNMKVLAFVTIVEPDQNQPFSKVEVHFTDGYVLHVNHKIVEVLADLIGSGSAKFSLVDTKDGLNFEFTKDHNNLASIEDVNSGTVFSMNLEDFKLMIELAQGYGILMLDTGCKSCSGETL